MENLTNNENNSFDNSEELLNLINNIQSKLNLDKEKEIINNNNFNDKNLEELTNKITENDINKDKTNENVNDSNQNPNINISDILKNIDINNIFNLLNNSNSNKENVSTFQNIDPSLILKFQKIIGAIGKEDPKKNLLLSLKPFLRKSRQDKLNDYISMLTIAKAIEIFSSKGSDE